MKLIVRNGALTTGSVFRLVMIGWFFGVGTLFVLALIPAVLIDIIVSNDSPGMILAHWLPILLVPVVLAGQAFVFGIVAAAGYFVFTRYRPVRLEIAGEPEAASDSLI